MTTYGLAVRNFVGPGEVPDIAGIYAYAERAEALGFESLWAWDHVLLGVEPSFPIVDSITMLGAVAARTRRRARDGRDEIAAVGTALDCPQVGQGGDPGGTAPPQVVQVLHPAVGGLAIDLPCRAVAAALSVSYESFPKLPGRNAHFRRRT